MENDQKSMGLMLVITFVALAVCAGAVFFMTGQKTDNEQPTKLLPVKEKQIRKPAKTVIKHVEPKRSSRSAVADKKKTEADEWKEAGQEMSEFLQTSKFRELMQRRMTQGIMDYLKDLFDKYNIDDKTRKEIADAVAASQFEFFNAMMASGYFRDKTEDKRKELGEKISDLQQRTEEQIKQLAGDAFLADAKDKHNAEQRSGFLNRLDRTLKKDKMTTDQRTAMDTLYQENQISQAEMFTLSKEELDQRRSNINNGAKEILSKEQYQAYKKTGDPLKAGHFGGFRKRR